MALQNGKLIRQEIQNGNGRRPEIQNQNQYNNNMQNQFDPFIDYSKNGDCSHAFPTPALRNGCTIKVSKKLAQQILINDITVTRLSKVRHLQLKHIGLGVHEVRLLPDSDELQIKGDDVENNCNRIVTSFY